MARNQEWKGKPPTVAPKVRHTIPQRHTPDRTACSGCGQVQGRHTAACPRRSQ